MSLGKLSLLPKAGTLTGANAGGYDMGVFKLNSAAVQQWVVQRGSAGTEQAGFVGQKNTERHGKSSKRTKFTKMVQWRCDL